MIRRAPRPGEVLDRLRGRISSASLRMGRGASRIMPSPTAWTVSGLFVSILAGALFAKGGGAYAAFAGLAVLLSGFLDIVDGSVARATNRVSRRGAFLDSNLDRVGEVTIYAGVLVGSYGSPLLVLLAVSLSLLVSYARAKADALQVSLAGVGIGERSERLIVIALASILGVVSWGVALVVVLAGITFAERVIRVSAKLR